MTTGRLGLSPLMRPGPDWSWFALAAFVSVLIASVLLLGGSSPGDAGRAP